MLLLAIGLIAGFVIWWERKPAKEIQSAAKPTTTVAQTGFQKLLGGWRREDSDYLIGIRRVAADGALDAGYFNPSPIHVAKAQATQEGAFTRVFIELRDTNYPGSTYNLTYDAANDRLVGTYYQAIEQQSFAVAFNRFSQSR